MISIIGKLGSGKSVFAASLFHSGRETFPPHRLFYFAFQDNSNGRSVSAAWASLIYQNLKRDRSVFAGATIRALKSRIQTFSPQIWTKNSLRETFQGLFSESRYPCIFVIDALDQCDEDLDAFMDSFHGLFGHGLTRKIKAVFMTRPGLASTSLSKRFQNLVSIDLDEEPQHEDAICLSIRHSVAEFCEKRSCQPVADMITDALCRRADAMYLLPTMAIKSLEKLQLSKKSIRERLSRFPQEISEVYRQCLEDIKEPDQQLVAAILLWVVFATRPLTTKELSSAVALDDTVESSEDLEENTSFDLFRPEGTRELVGPILKIKTVNGHEFVSLIHPSVRDFLLPTHDQNRSTAPAPPQWIYSYFNRSCSYPTDLRSMCSEANRTLANLCLRYYLLVAYPENGSLRSDADNEDVLDDPMFDMEMVTDQDRKSLHLKGCSKNEMMVDLLEKRMGLSINREVLAQDFYLPPDLIRSDNGSTVSEKLESWHESHQSAYKFALNQRQTEPETSRDEALKGVLEKLDAIPFDVLADKFPALSYCLENLPEHARHVTVENIAFHRSLAAFLSTEPGSIWMCKFWTLRDPAQNHTLHTALYFSVTLGLESEIRSLLYSGAKIQNSIDGEWDTAMGAAGSTGIVRIIYLLHKYAKLDGNLSPLWSEALHAAVLYGHQDAIMYILLFGWHTWGVKERKKNMKDRVIGGETTLDIAVRTRNQTLGALLVGVMGFNELASDAVTRGRVETLKWLLKRASYSKSVTEALLSLKKANQMLDFSDTEPEMSPRFWLILGKPPVTSLVSLLNEAAEHDQPACIEFLIQETTKSHEYDCPSEVHAYHIAAGSGARHAVVLFLTVAGVDINLVDVEGSSALHHACLNKQTMVAEELVKRGIDTTIVDSSGYTAIERLFLWTAKRLHSTDATDEENAIACLLRTWGSEKLPKIKPRGGGNLLHTALKLSSHYMKPVISTLLHWGADPYEPDDVGDTPLVIAGTKWTDTNLFCQLLQVCRPFTSTDPILCRILGATGRRDDDLLAMVKCLLAKGANVDALDERGRTALHYSTVRRKEVLEVIISESRETTILDNDGKTPIHTLMEDPHVEEKSSRLRILVKAGADPHIRDAFRKTPLDTYLEIPLVKDDNVLTTFKDYGCGLEDYSHGTRMKLLRRMVLGKAFNDARLVLRTLRQTSSSEIISSSSTDESALTSIPSDYLLDGLDDSATKTVLNFFLFQGARREEILPFANHLKLPAIDSAYASDKMTWRLAVLLPSQLERKRCLNQVTMEAVRRNDALMFRELVEEFPKAAEVTEYNKRSALSFFAGMGNSEIVEYLLTKEVDLEKADDSGRTALYWAARIGRLDIVKMLVDHGASITKFVINISNAERHHEVEKYLRDRFEQQGRAGAG